MKVCSQKEDVEPGCGHNLIRSAVLQAPACPLPPQAPRVVTNPPGFLPTWGPSWEPWKDPSSL